MKLAATVAREGEERFARVWHPRILAGLLFIACYLVLAVVLANQEISRLKARAADLDGRLLKVEDEATELRHSRRVETVVDFSSQEDGKVTQRELERLRNEAAYSENRLIELEAEKEEREREEFRRSFRR